MDARDRQSLVAEWSRALSAGGAVPTVESDGARLLGELADAFARGLVADPFDTEVGRWIGAALAEAGLRDPTVPIISAGVLGRIADDEQRADSGPRAAVLCAGMGRGHQDRLERESVPPPVAWSAEPNYLTADALRLVLDGAPIALVASGVDGRPYYANQAMADLVGVPVESLSESGLRGFAHPEEFEAIATDLARLARDRRGTTTIERRLVRADGSSGWGSFSTVYVRGADVRGDILLSAGSDVTERRRMQDELRWQARHDALTGLPNRRRLLERIEAVTATEERIGLCFADLDDFKNVNDRYGHQTGDEVLVTVADRLSESVRGEDCVIARLGGDEFVTFIAPPTDDRRVTAIADRLLASLDTPVVANGHRLTVTLSIGVVITEVDGRSADGLLDGADRGLYRAKAAGGHRWTLQVLDAPPGP